jgi:hypothetical protein
MRTVSEVIATDVDLAFRVRCAREVERARQAVKHHALDGPASDDNEDVAAFLERLDELVSDLLARYLTLAAVARTTLEVGDDDEDEDGE